MMVVGTAVAIAGAPLMGSDDAWDYWDERPDFGSPEYQEWQTEYDRLVERDDRRDLTGLILVSSGIGVATIGATLEAIRHVRWSTPSARYEEDEVIRYVLRHNSLLLNELGAPAAPPAEPTEPSSELNGTPEPGAPVALIGRDGALAIRE
jgi:hypothetical protein